MTRLPFRALLCFLFASLSAMPSCIFGGEKSFDVPKSYGTGDATYTLLYSTLGYDAAGTKHVLIRQNDVDAEIQQGLVFSWRAVNERGRQVAGGTAAYAGDAWTIPVWVADITEVDDPGEYRIVVETGGVALATDAFPVGDFVLSQSTLLPMALENAENRAAPIELDYGFYDSNTISGSAREHAGFLIGLIETYTSRRAALSNDQRERLRAAIERAVDYLLLISDPGSGEVDGESPARPYPDDDPDEGAAAALRGLARYAATFQTDFPEKAERAYRRARTVDAWLVANAPDVYRAPLLSTVAYDLYRYGGDARSLDRALFAVRAMGETYDLRTMDRSGEDTLPHMEGLYRLWRDLPADHPDRAFWMQSATRIGTQYKEMLLRNPFQVIAPGVSEEGEPSAAEQWDELADIDLPGEGEGGAIGNGWFLARAIDATYLAEITGDEELERVATASLLWVAGLNPGLPAGRVAGPDATSPFAAASFVIGTGARAALPWSVWEWPRTRPLATTLAGFTTSFTFEDDEHAGASSIALDGTWLYALAAYEDYLDPERPGPKLPLILPPGDGPRVTSASASEDAGVLRFRVTAGIDGGAPAEGALVTAAWSGAPLPGAAPEDAIRTAECMTDAGGVCLLVLSVADLPVRRPIRVAVTNIEHVAGSYTPGANASSAIVVVP